MRTHVIELGTLDSKFGKKELVRRDFTLTPSVAPLKMRLRLAAPKVGDRAPEIHLEKLLPEQPVDNASFEKFAGKNRGARNVGDVVRTLCGGDSAPERASC